MHKIRKIVAIQGYCLELEFDDGVRGTVDLSDLVGQGVFTAWRNQECFDQVRIGSDGELAWGDQIDLCPDALYLKVTGKSPEEVFPSLRGESTHA